MGPPIRGRGGGRRRNDYSGKYTSDLFLMKVLGKFPLVLNGITVFRNEGKLMQILLLISNPHRTFIAE